MFGSFINQARDKYASEKMSSLHSVDKSCRIRLMKTVSINRPSRIEFGYATLSRELA